MAKTLQVLPYHALHQGNCVAAKVLSQELWILVHVLRNHPSSSMTGSGSGGGGGGGGGTTTQPHLTPLELLHVQALKQPPIFWELVMVMDVEDHLSGGGGASSHPSTYSLSHLVVLPLP